MIRWLVIFLGCLSLQAQNGILSIQWGGGDTNLYETNLAILDAKVISYITQPPTATFYLKYEDQGDATNDVNYYLERPLVPINPGLNYGEALKYYFLHDTQTNGNKVVNILLQNETLWDFSFSHTNVTFDQTVTNWFDHNNQNDSYVIHPTDKRVIFNILDAEMSVYYWDNTVILMGNTVILMGNGS